MKVTLISDTHNKHNQLTPDLTGGDLIIHAGDISSMGREFEIAPFCKWYESLYYDNCVFIAGNHDWGFQNNVEKINKILENYSGIDYLQDNSIIVDVEGESKVSIYGSPWQPEFYQWAFNLQRNGEELKQKWDNIPANTDILITHGPAFGFVDEVESRRGQHLGCELLRKRIEEIRPKIHVCGHIHSGNGYYYNGHTHFFNASILNERYEYFYKPFSFDWNPDTNEIIFPK